MRVVFVHGACVRDGEWWWRPTAERLDARGMTSVAAELPSCGELGGRPGADGPGLAEDVLELRRVLAGSDEPTTLVGHSYGGIVISEAAAGVAGVARLVLISSYLPEVGESLASFGGEQPAPFLEIDAAAGTFAVRPELFVDTFMHDCPPAIVAESVSHLAHQSVSVVGTPVGASAWHHVPSTYVVCAGDRGTPPERQREFARRATSVIEVDTGHHPFLARPELVADIVAGSA